MEYLHTHPCRYPGLRRIKGDGNTIGIGNIAINGVVGIRKVNARVFTLSQQSAAKITGKCNHQHHE